MLVPTGYRNGCGAPKDCGTLFNGRGGDIGRTVVEVFPGRKRKPPAEVRLPFTGRETGALVTLVVAPADVDEAPGEAPGATSGTRRGSGRVV